MATCAWGGKLWYNVRYRKMDCKMETKQMKKILAIALAAAGAAMGANAVDLEAGFKAPPSSAKPQVWWHWMAGNVTRAGITADLEAMADAGIGGAILFDAGLGTRWGVPEGPLEFNTPEWYDTVKFAATEAKRLGLELGMANCSGWANSGGPWNTPYYAMKTVCFTETAVKGGAAIRVALPQPEDKVGFYRDIAVVAFPTPAEKFSVADWDFKSFMNWGRKYPEADTRVAPAAATVRREDVRDLTASFRDGTLACTLPAGDWTVLRVGYRALNRKNGTGTRLGKGLECDKLSKEALRIHWANYVEKTVKALGPGLAGPNGALKTVLNDSYEVGTQNWTHGFENEFARHAGYAITSWLPALCGRVVGSVAETERFYRDFRLTVTDAFATNYAGEMRRLAHACGLQLAIEPCGEIPSDDLLYGENADIPTAEFWAKLDSPPRRERGLVLRGVAGREGGAARRLVPRRGARARALESGDGRRGEAGRLCGQGRRDDGAPRIRAVRVVVRRVPRAGEGDAACGAAEGRRVRRRDAADGRARRDVRLAFARRGRLDARVPGRLVFGRNGDEDGDAGRARRLDDARRSGHEVLLRHGDVSQDAEGRGAGRRRTPLPRPRRRQALRRRHGQRKGVPDALEAAVPRGRHGRRRVGFARARREGDEPLAEPHHRRRLPARGLHVRARQAADGAPPQRMAEVRP